MRRSRVHPYGTSVRPTRLLSMLMVIAVLWMLFDRVRDPATWRVLLNLKDEAAIATVQEPAESKPSEAGTVVPGPNDLDEQQVAEMADMLNLVTDKTPLKPREMHAYWRLMTWGRTESVSSLAQRAAHDLPFTRLWEQPEKYRGKPITMRLHIRRVLKYDAPANPQELPFTYEAWGWTDESRSFPYVVVFPECPEGFPVGTDVRGDVVFVGYFLKLMSYTAFDVNRAAPLLIGRIEPVPTQAKPAPAPVDSSLLIAIVAIGAVVVGIAVWMQLRSRPVVRGIERSGDVELVASLSYGTEKLANKQARELLISHLESEEAFADGHSHDEMKAIAGHNT